jgi:hypothetical protein
MKPRSRVRPSTAIATLALFLALGGTSYAVSGGTPYTVAQINGSQLKNHTVAGIKLEPHTITAEDLDLSGFPQVPSAVQANSARTAQSADTATTAGTITGRISASQVSGTVAAAQSAQSAVTAQTAQSAQSAASAATITGTISGSQISGAVAAATNAANATNATNAANAVNATTAASAATATSVDGDQLANISATSGSASDVNLAQGMAGLSLAMRCTGGNVDIDATTSVSGASYGISGIANGASPALRTAEGDFNSGSEITTAYAGPSQLSFSYQAGGNVASGTITVFDDGGTCSAFGVAEYS